jgi:hypothetical protein
MWTKIHDSAVGLNVWCKWHTCKTKKQSYFWKSANFDTMEVTLQIDRFQVNNEYSRDGIRTEQIHIEILNHISHTCKILCTKKHNSAEGWKYSKHTYKTKTKTTKTIVLLNISKFCHNGVL